LHDAAGLGRSARWLPLHAGACRAPMHPTHPQAHIRESEGTLIPEALA